MYRMMIVEDEPWIRKGIEKAVPWRELGIEYIGFAGNGEEALQKLDSYLPDIILTDIMMPKMNGIELVGKIYEQWSSDVKVVILTGYNEFEYAREAIRYNVVDYLLKPINPVELRDIMTKITHMLDAKRNRSLQLLRLEIGNSIYEQFLIPGDVHPAAFDLAGYHACVACAMERLPIDSLREQSDADPIFEYPVGYAKIYVFCFSDPDQARRFLEQSAGALTGKYAAGVGGVVASSEDAFRRALNEAYTGMQQSLLTRTSETSSATDEWLWTAEREKEVVALLSAGSRAEIHDHIRRMVESAADIPNRRAMLLHLLMMFERYGHRPAGLQHSDWMYSLLIVKTEEAIRSFLEDFVLPAADELAAVWQRDNSSIAAGVLRYVDDHYADPNLSLSGIADVFNISTPYLSFLFKNELRINYVTYLTNKRIDRAKELLASAQDQIYQIGRAVGYHDVKYFIRVFKKMTGMTPKQFRDNIARRRQA